MIKQYEICFAYSPKCPKKCAILTEMICKNKKCKFFKTQEEFEEGQRRLEYERKRGKRRT